jgi:hypothetical protein
MILRSQVILAQSSQTSICGSKLQHQSNMSDTAPSLNPYKSPSTRNRSTPEWRITRLAIPEPLSFEGTIPAQVLAQIELRRYRDQVCFFGGLALGGGSWGTWYLIQHPHHPLAYGAISMSIILASVFTAWPLIYVYRLHRSLRESTQTMQGSVDSDGVSLTGGETANSDVPEQISWSSLSLALVNKSHAVLFRPLPDSRNQLLVFSSGMFKTSTDWQILRQQLQHAYQQAQRPTSTVRQVLNGIRAAIIVILVFAIAIVVALYLRKR